MRGSRHFWPLLLFLLPRLLPLVVAIAVAIGFGRQLGWDSLGRHEGALIHLVEAYPVAAYASFLLAYAVAAALSLPNAAVLTVVGGLLFGTVLGCVLTVIGATAGASLLLVVARSALGDLLLRRGGPVVDRLRARLRRDGFNFLLAVRLIPLFPFWAVNLAAAAGGIRLSAFVPATLLGIIPGSLVLSSLGAGVGGILAEGRTPDLSLLFTPRVLLPLLFLALLALLPPLLRRSALQPSGPAADG